MVVALSVGVAATSWAIIAFRGAPGESPSPENSLDLDSLRLAWTVDLPNAGSLREMGDVHQSAHHIYVLDRDQVVAFRKDCGNPCSPAWRGPVPGSDPERREMAVGDGVVYVSTTDQLFAFASACASDGSECIPLWFAELAAPGYANSLLVSGNVVRVIHSLGGEENADGVRAVAFESDCRTDGGRCTPLWTGDLGSGTIYSPGTVQGDVFYQQVGKRMTGFAASCGANGSACEPSFVLDARGDPHSQASSLYGPVLAGDELLVSSGDGNVYAFAPSCGVSCQPLWFGGVADYLEAYPVLAGGHVVTYVTGGIVAFPIGCRSDGGECDAAWRADVEGYAPIVYADDAYVVALNYRARRMMVFSAVCSGSCQPLWSVDLPASSGEIASDGRSLFVGVSGGTVLAYPLDCHDPCEAIAKAEVGGPTVQYLLVDDRGLYVGVGPGGIRLAAFLTTSGPPATVPPSNTVPLPTAEPGHPTYGWLFTDVAATRGIGEWHVEWVQTWATDEAPGDRRCNVTVWNAAGDVILRWDVIEASDTRQVPNGVTVPEEPALFEGWCEEERLDAPLAYSISDVRISDDGTSVSFRVGDPEALPPGMYVGGNQCIAAVFEPASGHLYSTQFTIEVQPGRHDFPVEGAQAAGADAVGIVRCEPFTGSWEQLTAEVQAAADQLAS